MAASSIWTVKAPSGTDTAAFRASKTLYQGAIGTETGVTAVVAGAARTTPTYSIGELLKVGWLMGINVSVKTGTSSRTSNVTVYCSAEKAAAFIAKCRTNPSGLTIAGKEVVSATLRRQLVLS
jgi:hypothetical protein